MAFAAAQVSKSYYHCVLHSTRTPVTPTLTTTAPQRKSCNKWTARLTWWCVVQALAAPSLVLPRRLRKRWEVVHAAGIVIISGRSQQVFTPLPVSPFKDDTHCSLTEATIAVPLPFCYYLFVAFQIFSSTLFLIFPTHWVIFSIHTSSSKSILLLFISKIGHLQNTWSSVSSSSPQKHCLALSFNSASICLQACWVSSSQSDMLFLCYSVIASNGLLFFWRSSVSIYCISSLVCYILFFHSDFRFHYVFVFPKSLLVHFTSSLVHFVFHLISMYITI